MCKLSVVVPVYNVAGYLDQCMASILEPRRDDVEFVLVDDGSTDESGRMCDAYAEQDARIRVIHQKNAGPSEARNTGEAEACGEYLFFMDSDDVLTKGALGNIMELLYKKAPDVVRIHRADKCTPLYDNLKETCIEEDAEDYYCENLYHGTLETAPHYYIVKTELLRKNKVRFPKGILHEDEYWTPMMLVHAKTVCDSKLKCYVYREDNPTSATHTPGTEERRAYGRLRVSQLLSQQLLALQMSGRMRKAFGDNIAAQYMFAVFYGGLHKKTVIDRRFPLRYARTPRYRAKAALFWLSPGLTCWMRAKRK